MAKIIDPQISLTMKSFKNIIRRLLAADDEHLYFSQTRDEYFADYKPNYPEKSAADLTISVNHWKGTGKIRGNFGALIPTINKYDDLKSLFNTLKQAEK